MSNENSQSAIARIQMQVMWNRLIAVVDEQAQRADADDLERPRQHHASDVVFALLHANAGLICFGFVAFSVYLLARENHQAEERLWTDRPVRLYRSNLVVESDGMESDLSTRRIRLTGSVQAKVR